MGSKKKYYYGIKNVKNKHVKGIDPELTIF